jgi:hypothetical protein
MLGGVFMALSSEGDIVYITENVTQQLGLHHVSPVFLFFLLNAFIHQI